MLNSKLEILNSKQTRNPKPKTVFGFSILSFGFVSDLVFSVSCLLISVSCFLLCLFVHSQGAQATVKLMMAESGNATVKIYDTKGKEIICLFDGYKDAGTYDLPWSGIDSSGNKVGSGVYMVNMKSGKYNEVKKIVIVK